MSILLPALLTGIAMFFQDVTSTILVQAQARSLAVLAGLADCVAWGLSFTVMGTGMDAIVHGSAGEVAAIVGAVTLANFWGNYLGVKAGDELIGRIVERASQARPARAGRDGRAGRRARRRVRDQ